MDSIYCVGNVSGFNHLLWKGDDKRFRIIEYKEFTPLITGRGYTLIDKKFIPAFETLLKNEVEIKPAKIFRLSTGEEWDNYCELIIPKHISTETIKSINTNTESIWQYEGHLFVSEEIKEKLTEISPKELHFSEGFSNFGG